VDGSISRSRLDLFARRVQDVTQRTLVLRERQNLNGALVPSDRLRVPPMDGSHAAESRLSMDEAGKVRERLSIGARGSSKPSIVEVEVPQLDERPGERLDGPGPCLGGESHGSDRAFRVAEQLPCVGDATVGGEVGPQCDHPGEGGEGLAVAAELDE
jgi:hypothetical protein